MSLGVLEALRLFLTRRDMGLAEPALRLFLTRRAIGLDRTRLRRFEDFLRTK
jgi:hypothetical protein